MLEVPASPSLYRGYVQYFYYVKLKGVGHTHLTLPDVSYNQLLDLSRELNSLPWVIRALEGPSVLRIESRPLSTEEVDFLIAHFEPQMRHVRVSLGVDNTIAFELAYGHFAMRDRGALERFAGTIRIAPVSTSRLLVVHHPPMSETQREQLLDAICAALKLTILQLKPI